MTAVWFLGSSVGARCSEPNTVGDTELAHRLARDISAAPPYAPGTYSCPADFGRSVTLYFHYAHRSEAETVSLTVTGCAAIATSDHTMGLQAAAIQTDLVSITPPDFSAS